MITPIELQSKTFKTGIGFDKKDVEYFISSLLGDYETLYKENIELKDKCNVLNEGINYYKTIEKTIQKALVLAEKTAEETKEAARQEAHAIKEEARAKAKLILMDAQNELDKIHQQTIQIVRQYEAYKAQFKYLAKAQEELLESDAFNIHIANLDAFLNQKDDRKEDKYNNLQKDAQTDKPKNTQKDAQTDTKSNVKKDVQIAQKDTVTDMPDNAQNGMEKDDSTDSPRNDEMDGQKNDIYDDFEFLNVEEEEQL
ncbi:MAG: DivIVA domain-containing protein [Anaerocolumna aminovalerica]|jgi:cell division initiation protein|uniref:DivIVA domain-containing protein n=1 Tax=Anaerocolumna aminovalerica TaxID=1527 RepID=UPI002913A1B6|nr:DivIVA domain-containing protein [Anaerocolumna aminovalerica]MDU6265010.1 DivIVA domain-containing protein [Anaerocolumna aminovalerica]